MVSKWGNMSLCQQNMKHCFPKLSSILIIEIFVVITIISIIIGITTFLFGSKLYFEKKEITLNQPFSIQFQNENNKQYKQLNAYLIIPRYYQSTRLYIQSVDYDTVFKSRQNYEDAKDQSLLLKSMPQVNLHFQIIDDQMQRHDITVETENTIFKDDKTNTAIFSKQFKQDVDNSEMVINWWRTSTYSSIEKFIGYVNLTNQNNIQQYQLDGQINILLAEKQSSKAYIILAENNILGSRQANYSIGFICLIYSALCGYMLKFGKENKKFQQ